VISVHAATGKLAWAFQAIHHDIWDYDFPQPTILFDQTIKGQMRHAIAAANKTGWVYMLDRRTGKAILGINEKPFPQSAAMHTYPTQPVPVGQAFTTQCPNKALYAGKKAADGTPFERIGCIFTPYTDTGYTVFAPAPLGGVDWPPSAYNQQTGYMYLCSKQSSAEWKSLPANVQAKTLKPLGNFFQVEGLFPAKGSAAKETNGEVVAMNMRSNRVAWKHVWPGSMCYSGMVTTAGGLTFVGTSSGHLLGYDAKSGKLLWTSPKLAAGANAPAMTYRLNGKQYVVVYAGGNGLSGGFSTEPVRYGSDLYAFALPS